MYSLHLKSDIRLSFNIGATVFLLKRHSIRQPIVGGNGPVDASLWLEVKRLYIGLILIYMGDILVLTDSLYLSAEVYACIQNSLAHEYPLSLHTSSTTFGRFNTDSLEYCISLRKRGYKKRFANVQATFCQYVGKTVPMRWQHLLLLCFQTFLSQTGKYQPVCMVDPGPAF